MVFEGAYALYYLVGDTELVLVRVLHGARDAAAMAGQGGFRENAQGEAGDE